MVFLTSSKKRSLKKGIAEFWLPIHKFKNAVIKPSPSTASIPVLCYHSVNNTYDNHADPVSNEMFEQHIKYLTDNWNIISVEDMMQALIDPASVPPNSLVITFDDGYKDNYSEAAPILEKFSTPACFFLPTAFLDGEVDLIGKNKWGPLTWDQVREMNGTPLFSFGAHAHTHTSLSHMPGKDAVQEVLISKDILEQKIGQPMKYFAYPNGQASDISNDAIQAVCDAGYEAAFSTFWHTHNSQANRLMLNRVMINGDDCLETLRLKCEGAYNYLYVIAKIRALRYPTLRY